MPPNGIALISIVYHKDIMLYYSWLIAKKKTIPGQHARFHQRVAGENGDIMFYKSLAEKQLLDRIKMILLIKIMIY